ncbi:MAG: glycosyltransferase, partial [Promicromonosporaceae bacterium]|nr:glycosyltransferase [Promicromonosporaceae bacterium]
MTDTYTPLPITVIVPTFNEGPNVAELVRRLGDALPADSTVLFVDDSKDDTPQIIEQVAETASLRVLMIHRTEPIGGLSGAVVEGLQKAEADGARWMVVM